MSDVRTTSLKVYDDIRVGGLLSRMRWAVYNHLFRCGPLTGAELDEQLRGAKGGRGHYHKRLSELRDIGVARELDARLCAVTGHHAIAWDVTANMPSKAVPKPRETLDSVRRDRDLLRRENRRLRSLLDGSRQGDLFASEITG